MPPSGSINLAPSYNSVSIQEQNLDSDAIELCATERTQEADFETAINYAQYGKFQYFLLAISGLVYATCAISSTAISFVLPSAECDFHLSSLDKGKLTAIPLIGMIFGCTIWGSIANIYGRKAAIVLSLFVDFLAAAISSMAQSFPFFLVCRLFNGFGIIGATSIIFSYLGEFLSVKNRDKMLGRLEVFWNFGIILLPGVAWFLLNHHLSKTFEDHDFTPWRMFVLVCSLPSLLSSIFIYFMPESPKFLIASGQFQKAKLVFQKIYHWNTGKKHELYPVLSLEGEFSNNNNGRLNLNPGKNRFQFIQIVDKLSNFTNLLKVLFSQPYLKYLSITSFADFGLMASYYTLILWFPELFDRFALFEMENPNNATGICIVSSQSLDPQINFDDCESSVNHRVFLDTFIIGLSCIPTSVSLSYFMDRLGKKVVLVNGLVLSGLAVLALNWVRNTTQTLILSCIFEALTSILEAVIFCVIVDLFPTNLRAVSLAITATSGRLGAIFGNMTFGLLLDLNCIIPIYLFGSLLIASALLCLALPKSDKYIIIQ